ncbi:MAG: hypothetical protein HY720_21400 [Planctomycetes bacterium]|nr:hypothetical protein [Planctomycetota bacterium]
MDRVLVCPRCHSLPTFRRGCRRCGSGRVSTERLIHHFACGHYAPETRFETERGLVCPRCGGKALVIGTDYEFAEGAHRCADCGLSDSAFETIAHCLACSFRFPASEAIEKDLTLYEVNRIVPAELGVGRTDEPPRPRILERISRSPAPRPGRGEPIAPPGLPGPEDGFAKDPGIVPRIRRQERSFLCAGLPAREDGQRDEPGHGREKRTNRSNSHGRFSRGGSSRGRRRAPPSL